MTFGQQTDWKVSAYRIWNIFTIDPTLNLTINCAHVMVNLFGRRSIRRPSLTDIHSGLTPSAGREYDTVSTSSLYDPTRLKTDSGVLFCGGCSLGAGLNKGRVVEIRTSELFLADVGSLIFASFPFIVCAPVIWRDRDDLVSDPAKQVLERHGKWDRREDGAVFWTDGMIFRRLTRQLQGQRTSFLK